MTPRHFLAVRPEGAPAATLPQCLHGPEEIEDLGNKANETLAAKAQELRVRHPGIAVETTLVQAKKPAEAILRTIYESKPALVVMGTHGRGFWSRAMLGSVTSGDCNSCHTQDGRNGAPGRVLAP